MLIIIKCYIAGYDKKVIKYRQKNKGGNKIKGQNIRKLRKEKNMSQQELAKILNVSQRTISGYEKNQITASFDTMTDIADYFRVPLDYFADRYKNEK